MLDRQAAAIRIKSQADGSDVVAAVRDLSLRELAPIVRKIDAEGFYPESVMRAFGRAGAFASHLPRKSLDDVALGTAIRSMAAAGEHCLSTAFCMWCQNALAWYIFASDNEELKASLGRRVAAGEALGGTALSNPMKTLFGIEPIRLKGARVEGGYAVLATDPARAVDIVDGAKARRRERTRILQARTQTNRPAHPQPAGRRSPR